MKRLLLLLLLVLGMSVLVACGGDDEGDDDTATPRSTTTRTSTPRETGTETEKTATEDEGTATADPEETATEEPEETATPGDEPTSTPDDGGPDTALGQCDVEISGDESVNYTGGGGAAAIGTDYWYTEDELRQTIEILNPDLSDEEVEEQLADGPVFFVLLINCTSSDGTQSISILPSNETTYDDVPFEPGTYVIKAGGALGGDTAAGEFSVLMTLGETSYQVTEDGELDISKFDESGIEGTFTFGAEDAFPTDGTPGKIAVNASFNFECTGGSVCE